MKKKEMNQKKIFKMVIIISAVLVFLILIVDLNYQFSRLTKNKNFNFDVKKAISVNNQKQKTDLLNNIINGKNSVYRILREYDKKNKRNYDDITSMAAEEDDIGLSRLLNKNIERDKINKNDNKVVYKKDLVKYYYKLDLDKERNYIDKELNLKIKVKKNNNLYLLEIDENQSNKLLNLLKLKLKDKIFIIKKLLLTKKDQTEMNFVKGNTDEKIYCNDFVINVYKLPVDQSNKYSDLEIRNIYNKNDLIWREIKKDDFIYCFTYFNDNLMVIRIPFEKVDVDFEQEILTNIYLLS